MSNHDSQAKLTAAHAQGDKMELQLEQCARVQMQMQAKIDRLMIEFCPDEMTPEQVKRWADCQVPLPADEAEKVDAALAPERTVTEACPDVAHMGEHACRNRAQCWEPCGDLGHSEEHARVAPEQTVAVDFDPCAPCCEPVSPLLPGLERNVELQSGRDGVWVHCHAGSQHFSVNLDLDPMAVKFCNAYRAEISRLKGSES